MATLDLSLIGVVSEAGNFSLNKRSDPTRTPRSRPVAVETYTHGRMRVPKIVLNNGSIEPTPRNKGADGSKTTFGKKFTVALGKVSIPKVDPNVVKEIRSRPGTGAIN